MARTPEGDGSNFRNLRTVETGIVRALELSMLRRRFGEFEPSPKAIVLVGSLRQRDELLGGLSCAHARKRSARPTPAPRCRRLRLTPRRKPHALSLERR